jgi:hypothetical protein
VLLEFGVPSDGVREPVGGVDDVMQPDMLGEA